MAACNERLQALLEECKTWATKGVNIDGYEINAAGKEERIAVDICQHVGCDTNDTKEKKAYDDDFLSRKAQGKVSKIFLSSEFNEHHPAGRAKVIQFIENAFDEKGGGGIVSAGGTKGKNIVFKCFRHRAHVPLEKKTETARDTSTAKPQNKEGTCQWRFTLYIEIKGPMMGRYYFYKDGSGNRFHTGHAPKKEDEIIKRLSQLDGDELDITADGIDANVDSQSMASMFEQRTGLASRRKMNKLLRHTGTFRFFSIKRAILNTYEQTRVT